MLKYVKLENTNIILAISDNHGSRTTSGFSRAGEASWIKMERHGSIPTVAMPRQVHVLRMVGVPSLVILKMSSM